MDGGGSVVNYRFVINFRFNIENFIYLAVEATTNTIATRTSIAMVERLSILDTTVENATFARQKTSVFAAMATPATSLMMHPCHECCI